MHTLEEWITALHDLGVSDKDKIVEISIEEEAELGDLEIERTRKGVKIYAMTF